MSNHTTFDVLFYLMILWIFTCPTLVGYSAQKMKFSFKDFFSKWWPNEQPQKAENIFLHGSIAISENFNIKHLWWSIYLAAWQTLLKTDSIIDVIFSWKLAANEELNRTLAVLRNVIEQRFNTNSSKEKFLLLQTNKILGIVFAKTGLFKKTERDSMKWYSTNFRSCCLKSFCQNGALKNCTKVTGKHLC